MSVKWEKTGKTSGELTFEISQEEVKKGLDQAFKRVKKNLRVPGFRKGHVSRVVFDQFYGEEALYEDALNIVLQKLTLLLLKKLVLPQLANHKLLQFQWIRTSLG
jgi:trigger factor